MRRTLPPGGGGRSTIDGGASSAAAGLRTRAEFPGNRVFPGLRDTVLVRSVHSSVRRATRQQVTTGRKPIAAAHLSDLHHWKNHRVAKCHRASPHIRVTREATGFLLADFSVEKLLSPRNEELSGLVSLVGSFSNWKNRRGRGGKREGK